MTVTVVGNVDDRAAAWVNAQLTLLQVPAEVDLLQALAVNDAGQIVSLTFFAANP